MGLVIFVSRGKKVVCGDLRVVGILVGIVVEEESVLLCVCVFLDVVVGWVFGKGVYV